MPEGWDSTKVAGVKDGTITVGSNTNVAVKAPIPIGYTVSSIETEDDIAEGMVIYQETEAVDATSITTRNQFVWIPVPDINSMVMCKSNASGSICNIVLENGELVCKTHGNATGATNMCGRLYGVDSIKDNDVYKTQMNFGLNTQTFTENSGYREPDLVTYHDKDSNTSYMIAAGVANAAALKTQLQNDFYDMAKSVALYKGFYIGRYEAGYTTETVPETGYTSVRGQKVLNADASSANMWYGLYKHLRTTMGTLSSQMIWGCQYDQAIKFIKENKGSTGLDPEIGHTSIGLKGSPNVSGAEGINDIMKNTYDLEGNYWEWTAQAYSSFYRAHRGGNYYYVANGDFYPASRHYFNFPSVAYMYYTSRATLYVTL